MAGWDYIKGETGYNRPFVLFDKGTGKAVDGTGVTSVTMTIFKSNLTEVGASTTDVALTVDTANPLRVLLAVNAGTPNVPQTTGSYITIFTVTIGSEIRKTYELDLRVFFG